MIWRNQCLTKRIDKINVWSARQNLWQTDKINVWSIWLIWKQTKQTLQT